MTEVKMLTPLEIIDKSIAGIKAQGGFAIGQFGSCSYSMKDDDKQLCCAVGVLLDPEDAKVWDERGAVECDGDTAIQSMLNLPSCRADLLKVGIDPERDADLLGLLQQIHDGNPPGGVEVFEERALALREKYKPLSS